MWSLVFTIPVFLTSTVFMYIPGLKHVQNTEIVNMILWVIGEVDIIDSGSAFLLVNDSTPSSTNMDVLIELGTNTAYFYSVYSVLRAYKREISS